MGIAAVALAGCGGWAQDLDRARVHYDDARYEEALLWLARMERGLPEMSVQEQAVFHYLRGMSAYRLGRRHEARHELALARELARHPDVDLGARWTRWMERALSDLRARPTGPAGAAARGARPSSRASSS